MEDSKITTKRILLYLLITFIITYAVELFLITPMASSTDMNQAMIAQLLISCVMFLPAIGAVLTRLLTKEGFQVEGLYLAVNVKKNLKYFALVWFGFVGLVLVGTVLYFVIFPRHYDPEMSFLKATLLAQGQPELSVQELKSTMLIQIVTGVLFAPFLNFVNCFGEEWGWRGYLLPKMLKKMKVVPTLLITGVIWGLWHVPLTALGHNYGVGYPGFPFTGILAMCVFCIVIGIILSYVTIKTKSCIPAVMGHGLINGVASTGIYYTSLEHPYNVFLGPAPIGLIGGIGFIILAAVLLYKLYQEEKAGKLWEI